MTVEWGSYESFDPGVDRPLHEVTRREARAAFKLLMDSRLERIEALRRLLSANGIVLAGDEDGLRKLNRWYLTEVEGDGDADTVRLRPIWYSVMNDLALFL